MISSKQMLKAFPLMCMALAMGQNAIAASPIEGAEALAIVQQTITVKGTVTDAEGEPLIGVNVLEVGTTNGTVTDLDGNFTLNNVKPNAKLQVSYIGYTSQVIALNGKRSVKVVLAEDTETLDEVVVVGYGVVRKADLAGSVAVLDNKNFKEQPITQVSEALDGRVAGVTVENSGGPGADIKIRVRGANSVNQSNDPLYVVDGIVRESGLSGLNPEDIQSMQVLKDASSTAIYGARGSNGVVLITTKTGKSGQKNITLDTSWGFSNVAKRLDIMDAKTYASALKEVKLVDPVYSGNGIDWQDEMFRMGLTQNYKVAISNGTDKTQYYVSGNYTNNEGIIINTNNERFQAKANINSELTSWLSMTTDVNAAHNIRHGMGFSGKSNAIWSSMIYSPTIDMFDEFGNYHTDPYNAIADNPIGKLKEQASEYVFDVFNGRLDFRFKLAKGLTFTTTNGVDFYEFHGYNFATKKVSPQSSMSNYENNRMMLQTTNNLTYIGNWGDHHLTATGVWEATSSTRKSINISGSNLLTESVGWWNVGMAANRSEENGYTHNALLSGVGRVIYNYGNRYMFTGTFRADGSSRFSQKKWGYFPSAALAWTVSNEKFMQNFKALTNIKVRGSWGMVGNQNINPYSTLGLMSTANFDFGTGNTYTGYWSNSIATPNVTWEKTKQFDLGIEFTTLGGKVDVTIDYFSKYTTDALLSRTLPYYLGHTSFMSNDGEVSNKGFDFTVNARLIQNKNFTWTSTLNGTYVKNKVEKLSGSDDEFIQVDSPASGMVDYAQVIKVGYPLGTFWGYTWTGLDEKGNDTYLTDANGDKVRSDIGHATPTFTAGWNNQFTYKNWSLNLFFNSAWGAKRLNLMKFTMANMVGDSRFITLTEAYTQAFDKGGNFYGSFTNNDPKPVSDKWVENSNYVRLQNLTLAYNLGKNIVKFADVRLSLSAQNLFTITKYSGQDPAGSSFGANVDAGAGIDMGAYPTARTYTVGVRFNF